CKETPSSPGKTRVQLAINGCLERSRNIKNRLASSHRQSRSDISRSEQQPLCGGGRERPDRRRLGSPSEVCVCALTVTESSPAAFGYFVGWLASPRRLADAHRSRTGCSLGRPKTFGRGSSRSRRANSASVRSVRWG